MKRFLYSCFLITCTVILLTSCGTTGSGVLFTERSINPADVKFQRVAILPNRLPLNLQDPEMWRTFNFNVMKKRFEREGYQVIDYATSVEMFNKSGLPMEDTKVSRDKYAELAAEMGADLLIFPYYGTSFRITGFTDKNNFEVVGSLQVYLADQNDFMTRIDFTGKNFYSAFTKIIPLFSGLSMIIMGAVAADSPGVAIVFAVLSPAISIATLIPALKPPRKRYMKAFNYSINKGLDQFFIKYNAKKINSKNQKPAQVAKPVGTITPAQQGQVVAPTEKKDSTIKRVQPAQVVTPTQTSPPGEKKENTVKPVQPANAPSTPANTNPYAGMTLEKLEQMKQQAVDAKDFKKAATIKEEIDRRKK